MAIKFRNSFLGFNKDDVLKYIYSVKETAAQNEAKLSESEALIKKLTDELESVSSALNESNALCADLQAKVNDFEQREAALTKLSESIGKLYLVAKANARTIISTAEENVKISRLAVDKNLQTATFTGDNLSDIENELAATAQKFSAEIKLVREKLEETKSAVKLNDAKIGNGEAVLDKLIETIDTGVSV